MQRYLAAAALVAAAAAGAPGASAEVPGCECLAELPASITREHGEGAALVKTDDGLEWPADFGTSCAVWDAAHEPACTEHGDDLDAMPQFCSQPWCYVADPAACARAQGKVGAPDFITPSFVFADQTKAAGDELFFSNAACGGVNLYAHWGCLAASNAAACAGTSPVCGWSQSEGRCWPTIGLDLVLRDFKRENPDMNDGGGFQEGLVEPQLDSDFLPVCVSDEVARAAGNYDSCASFDMLYRDVEGVNARVPFQLRVPHNLCTDVLKYENASFFPVDGKGFNEAGHEGHNFHFSTQLTTAFKYRGGEVFDFRGDDDVWVFIEGRLVIDLGGLHGPMEKSVALDDLDFLEAGRAYRLDMFHAERHETGSNFMLTTTIVQDDGTCPSQCHRVQEQGHCDTETGACVCYDKYDGSGRWAGPDCGCFEPAGMEGACPAAPAALRGVPIDCDRLDSYRQSTSSPAGRLTLGLALATAAMRGAARA